MGAGFLLTVLSATWPKLNSIAESWFTGLLAPLGVLLLVIGTGLFWYFRVVEAYRAGLDARGSNPVPGD